MKHNWKKQYSLQEISLDKDISEAVRKRTLEKMSEYTQKGNIVMKTKNKKRTAIICAAAAALLSVSAIGIHAAASSNIWQEIKFWINGEEMTASISQMDDNTFCIIQNVDEVDSYSYEYIKGEGLDVVEIETTFCTLTDPNTKFYTELDDKNRLLLKADTDDEFAVDVTDAIKRNESYIVTCDFGNGCFKSVTVEGTLDDPIVTVTPCDAEVMEDIELPSE